jgi:hypothetical protein
LDNLKKTCGGPPISRSVRTTAPRPRARRPDRGAIAVSHPPFPPPESTALRDYKRRAQGHRRFPFCFLRATPPLCSPAHPLPPPLFTGERHFLSTSSSIEPTRRSPPTLLRVETTYSPSRRSVMPPGECSPPPSSSSWSSASTVVPCQPPAQARAARAPSSSSVAHRPAVSLW